MNDLYHAERDRMLTYIGKRVGGDDAEDILQGAWVRALPGIDTGNGSALAYVWRAIGWEIQDHRKRQRPTVPLEVDVAGYAIDLDTSHDIETMMAAVTALNCHQREAIEIHLAGVSDRAAGERLGLTHAAVGYRRKAAIETLRGRLDPGVQEGA